MLVALALLLLGPALLINLGLLPLTVDEPIRALVALELRDSGNYFVSTMQGVLYYNKPPLYNWLLLGVFRVFGNESEWTIRIPTVFFLLAFAGSIWGIVRRYLGNRVGVITALAFVTSGRILFYDAFQGLIDMSYSWVTYLSFMAMFYFGQRRQWAGLFGVSYGLAAVGFMLKGLPALVFQGLMLVVYLGYSGRWAAAVLLAARGGRAVFAGAAGRLLLPVQPLQHPRHLLPDPVDRIEQAHGGGA